MRYKELEKRRQIEIEQIERITQRKKLTQEELASEIGVSKITILRWENGERQIKPDKAQALADYFGVPVGYLLGYDVQILEAKERNFEALDSLEKSIKEAFEATNSVVEIRIQGIVELLKKLTSGIANDEYDKETILEILKTLEELTKGFESDISDMMEFQAKYSATQIHKNMLQKNIDKTIEKISNQPPHHVQTLLWYIYATEPK